MSDESTRLENDADAVPTYDARFTRAAIGKLRPLTKLWFRSEVYGLDRLNDGGALIVGNHSGGFFAMDIPVFAVDYYERFGFDRPLYSLAHDILFQGGLGSALRRAGLLPANNDNAIRALKAGARVIVFPGGDYDAFRPTSAANTIDFGVRTGYVRTAIAAGVPIVPLVSIGGQENQLYLTRGTDLARRLGVKKRFRLAALPVTFGFPFGFSLLALPLNLPLPTKIVSELLEPIDVIARFGADPDVAEVDTYVRTTMQEALDRLAEERRFPVIG